MNQSSLNDKFFLAFICFVIFNIIKIIIKDRAGIFDRRIFLQMQNIPVIMQREFYKMNCKILFMQRKVYQLCERNSTTISSLYEMILIVNAVYDVPLVILAQIISFFRQFSVKVCGLAKYPGLNPANVSCRPVYPRGVADSSGVLPVYQRCLSAAICCLPDVLNRFTNAAGELPEDVRVTNDVHSSLPGDQRDSSGVQNNSPMDCSDQLNIVTQPPEGERDLSDV